jgi:hypothetical protein
MPAFHTGILTENRSRKYKDLVNKFKNCNWNDTQNILNVKQLVAIAQHHCIFPLWLVASPQQSLHPCPPIQDDFGWRSSNTNDR